MKIKILSLISLFLAFQGVQGDILALRSTQFNQQIPTIISQGNSDSQSERKKQILPTIKFSENAYSSILDKILQSQRQQQESNSPNSARETENLSNILKTTAQVPRKQDYSFKSVKSIEKSFDDDYPSTDRKQSSYQNRYVTSDKNRGVYSNLQKSETESENQSNKKQANSQLTTLRVIGISSEGAFSKTSLRKDQDFSNKNDRAKQAVSSPSLPSSRQQQSSLYSAYPKKISP